MVWFVGTPPAGAGAGTGAGAGEPVATDVGANVLDGAVGDSAAMPPHEAMDSDERDMSATVRRCDGATNIMGKPLGNTGELLGAMPPWWKRPRARRHAPR